MKLIFTKILFTTAMIFCIASVFAQEQSPLSIALDEVNNNYQEWNLTKSDITDMFVSDLITDKKTGISRVYFQQRYAGIRVNSAMINISIDPKGDVFFVAKQFIPDLSSKINTVIPALTGKDALDIVLTRLEIIPEESLKIKKQEGTRLFIFEGAEFALSDVRAELQFQLSDQAQMRLAWNIIINPIKSSDSWTIYVDALTGEFISQHNLTVYCSHQKGAYHNHDAHCREKKQEISDVSLTSAPQSVKTSMLAEDGSTYNVFALPIESPAHGDRIIVENPAWLTASPFGWHDTNGIDGPEYTITRGNNVWAYQDRDGNGMSSADEPDGGADLIFDFSYNEEDEPIDYIDAATTNLFYMVNTMHDFAYAYGMDEANGAFQINNYGNDGVSGDPVIALAQQAAEAGGINNANFSQTIDGESGIMNMYVWDQTNNARYLQVDAPSNIVGVYQTGITEGWGATIGTSNPVSGIVVESNDNVFNATSTDACEELVNGAEVMGKIALVDRGSCDFSTKALNAQNSGAIAVIVCDYSESANNMSPGADGSQVTIPVVRIKSSDCAILRQNVADGLEVTLVAPEPASPTQLDGDLDNGIIAHEYGHGISGRLTCGPGQFSLSNDEQRDGEGWSDFFSLVMTVKEGDTGEMSRGLANYVERQEVDGFGIRRYPYSTDMSINPLTYRDVASNTEIHALGEVWCAILWDLYWAFVEQDGWDADIYEGTGGNNMAIQLVFEGMKNQACNPGFVDGRDAILAADVALNGGANQCLIWGVFARRGVGFYADQGSNLSATDQIEDFELLPICVQELKISKEVSPIVNAGDNIEVTLTIINHKTETLTGVVVSDEIPTGTNYVVGSGSLSGMVTGNTVNFDLGSLNYEDEIVITYEISTDVDAYSIQKFYEDVEGPIPNWSFDTFYPNDVTNNWQQSNNNSYSGEKSFYANNIGVASIDAVVLTSPIMITGDNPVLRFYHNYNTQSGADAGIFEVTTGNPADISTLWLNTGNDFFRGEYSTQVEYLTFSIPNLEAFSGNSDGWISSYVDMSSYIGEEVYIRYRFANNEGGPVAVGWFVDDIEFMDMVNYTSEACVSSAQGDNACDSPEGRGTVIESQVMTSTFEPVGENLTVAVYPNPANDFVHVRMNTAEATDVKVTLYSVDGRLLQSQDVKAIGEMNVPMNVSTLAEGFYFLHVQADGNVYTEKLVIK